MSHEPLALKDHLDNEQEDFLADVLKGLSEPQKRIPSKYFYDDRGSHLFDEICDLPEYYLTRTELELLRAHMPDIREAVGASVAMIELGSGSGIKTELVLDGCDVAEYLPVDVARSHLQSASRRLKRRFPDLHVAPICADFTQPNFLPEEQLASAQRRVVFFPGSTIGNFDAEQADELLSSIATCCDPHGGLLIGVDLQKPTDILEAAYNDRQGVTAEFNRNLLVRMKRELQAELDIDQFEHEAIYNHDENRIELYLRSKCDQQIVVEGEVFDFAAGERVLTEYSHKYDIDQFHALAQSHGLELSRVWTDAEQKFAILFLEYSGLND